MKKIKVNLFDNLTTHSVPAYGYRTFSPFQRPKYIEYHREGQEISVYTDKSLNLENILKDPAKIKVAWLVECREVHPHAYLKILELSDVFDYIFTFDEELLKMGDKFVKTPIGTSRIIDRHAKIYKKTKSTSMIVSKKKWCVGHKFRHDIVMGFRDPSLVDMWGEAFKPMPQGAKILALAEYRYTISVENWQGDNYFTDKPTDPFRVGTVPVYWGPKNFSKFFNMDGVIVFETAEELNDIIPTLTEKRYQSMLPAIKDNFELVKNWLSMDDTFANNLKEITNG